MDDFYHKLNSIITLFTASPLLKRQLQRTANDLDLICTSFQRLIETRFVAYLVEAVERVLTNRSVAVVVLRDMIGSGTLVRDAAKTALKNIEDPSFLLDALVILDFMRPAIALSKAGQATSYTVFDDKAAVSQYLSEIDRLTDEDFHGTLEDEGPDVVRGEFRGSTLEPFSRYPSARRTDETQTGDLLRDATDRRRSLAQTILRLSDDYLKANDIETLITDVF